ncbi:MAG: T9SS type A sorting domain-containing protein, partial [Anaerolineae bacterium]|nr:T9SS type A sorting domain-containing protein [Anaerolineae bacterium]
DSTGDPATFAIIFKTSSENTVDAWGTIRLPFGDVSCLRIRTIDIDITAIYSGGLLLQSDTSRRISYAWVTKDHGGVVGITSQEDETNPNFTDASSFTLLQSTVTAVEEPDESHRIPDGFMLTQNYPNPFAHNIAATTIRFALPQATFTEIAVFNLLGEQVCVLTSQVLSSGTHAVRWDGRDESGRLLASGTYVYRLKAGDVQMSRTLLLLK